MWRKNGAVQDFSSILYDKEKNCCVMQKLSRIAVDLSLHCYIAMMETEEKGVKNNNDNSMKPIGKIIHGS